MTVLAVAVAQVRTMRKDKCWTWAGDRRSLLYERRDGDVEDCSISITALDGRGRRWNRQEMTVTSVVRVASGRTRILDVVKRISAALFSITQSAGACA